MIKNSAFLMIGILVFLLASCATGKGSLQGTGVYELALVTDSSTDDDNSFVQGSWEGLVQFAKEKNISHKFYRPAEENEAAYLAIIDLAVENGARIIVAPGFFFEVPVFIAQYKYPNVRFILVDSVPRSPAPPVETQNNAAAQNPPYRTANNTVGILYAEDQAGFLAGYAAVKDGYRRLGFMGGVAVAPVARFGCGFIQGAEYAAEELGLEPGAITINYHYTGSFLASPQVQSLASSWYSHGTELIFACGGAIGNSVMAAAEQAYKKVIGVDVDQSAVSPSVVTSALKGLQASVYACIASFYSGRFPGGQILVFSAANSGVGLPMGSSRFMNFTKGDYDTILQKLVDGSVPRLERLDSEGSPMIVPVTISKIEVQK